MSYEMMQHLHDQLQAQGWAGPHDDYSRSGRNRAAAYTVMLHMRFTLG